VYKGETIFMGLTTREKVELMLKNGISFKEVNKLSDQIDKEEAENNSTDENNSSNKIGDLPSNREENNNTEELLNKIKELEDTNKQLQSSIEKLNSNRDSSGSDPEEYTTVDVFKEAFK
jgi:predicted RNase H-like nuclease (RuvC/YqgF family)